jgi:hypothetical protein
MKSVYDNLDSLSVGFHTDEQQASGMKKGVLGTAMRAFTK